MALRSHDSATSLKSTDRFSDAMRVLSRRGDRAVVVPRRGPSLVVSATKSARPDPADLGVHVATELPVRDPLTPAERRRRLLLGLLGSSLLSLALAVTVMPVLLWVHVLADLLVVAFVVHLRRQAVLRAQRRARVRRSRPVAAAAVAPVRRRRVAGIPDRMPARPAPLTTPLPAPPRGTRTSPSPPRARAARRGARSRFRPRRTSGRQPLRSAARASWTSPTRASGAPRSRPTPASTSSTTVPSSTTSSPVAGPPAAGSLSLLRTTRGCGAVR